MQDFENLVIHASVSQGHVKKVSIMVTSARFAYTFVEYLEQELKSRT
jgi:hypothetical protein